MSWHAYVFPCVWEDHCKIGFSRDPLSRIQQFHPRWFEFFDLDAGAVVDAESERDARDLELRLRAPLREHRAPAPLRVNEAAGGVTEWLRGAAGHVSLQLRSLREEGYSVHAPLRPWMQQALRPRAERLYAVQQWLLSEDPMHQNPAAWRQFRQQADACAALGVSWGSA